MFPSFWGLSLYISHFPLKARGRLAGKHLLRGAIIVFIHSIEREELPGSEQWRGNEKTFSFGEWLSYYKSYYFHNSDSDIILKK